jgi:hypothetical protein
VEAALTELVLNKLRPGRAPSQADLCDEIPIEGIEEVLWTINGVMEFFFPAEAPECLREAREAWFKLACYCKHSLLMFHLGAAKTEIGRTTSTMLSNADVGEGGWAEKVERERATVENKKE